MIEITIFQGRKVPFVSITRHREKYYHKASGYSISRLVQLVDRNSQKFRVRPFNGLTGTIGWVARLKKEEYA